METTSPAPQIEQNTRPRFLTLDETAVELRLHPVSVRRLVSLGAIPVVRVGRRTLVPTAFFDDIERNALAGMRSRVPEGMPVESEASSQT